MSSEIDQLRSSLVQLTAKINAMAIENSELIERMEYHIEKLRSLEFDAYILELDIYALSGSLGRHDYGAGVMPE